MKRFWLFLRSEIKLLLTHRIILLVALIQPALMYALMSVVFVNPAFDLNIEPAQTQQEQNFLSAMQQVGKKSGVSYINPVISDKSNWIRQFIEMETMDDTLHVKQTYGNVDTNLIKNLRNRVTAAALVYWQNELGDQAIRIDEQPLLPKDVVYIAYFGLALIPMGIFLSTAITSAMLGAYEFENGSILEIQLSPRPVWQHMMVQFLRIIIIGLLSAMINICNVGWISGVWPTQIPALIVPVCLLSLAGGCLGMFAGLITRKALPAFLIALVVSLLNWLFGNAFGLSTGFAGWYETFSSFALNRYMVEILFPHYYHLQAGNLWLAWLVLGSGAVMMCLGVILFRQKTYVGGI